MWIKLIGVSAAAMLMLAASLAPALTVAGDGTITSWGFKPFGTQRGDWTDGAPPNPSGAGAVSVGQNSTQAWTEANNASPIDFPGSPDYVPAPQLSASDREHFDEEFLAWRLVNGGTQIQVLGISSLDPNAGYTYNGRTFHQGDIFIDVNGDSTYDKVITVGQWSTPLNDPLWADDDPLVGGNQTGYSHTMAVDLYNVGTVHGITDQGGFGGYSNASYPNIPSALNPFTLRSGTAVASSNMSYSYQTYNYGTVNGANEDGTWIMEWTFDLAALGAPLDPLSGQYDLSGLTFHWTLECGNDLITRGPRLPEPTIPEPATVALMGLGLASLGFLRRRRVTA